MTLNSCELNVGGSVWRVPNARIFLTERSHDLARLTVMERRLPMELNGLPAKIRWGKQSHAELVGYIDQVETEGRERHIRLRGASVLMENEKLTEKWRLKSFSQIARSIATIMKFGTAIDNFNPRVKEYWQEEQNTWEFLTKVAREENYQLYVSNVTLHLHDRRRIWKKFIRTAPLITWVDDHEYNPPVPDYVRGIVGEFKYKVRVHLINKPQISKGQILCISRQDSRLNGPWSVLHTEHVINDNRVSVYAVLGRTFELDNGERPQQPGVLDVTEHFDAIPKLKRREWIAA